MANELREVPPQAVVLQLLTNLWAAQAVATFARLGVADRLAHGPRSAGELAAAVGADAAALYRLLRGVADAGVVFMESDGRFSLSPVGELLRADVPGSLRSLLIAETAPGHWRAWGEMEHAVRTGGPATTKALGRSVWEYYADNPEEGRCFAEAMTGLSALATQAVLAAYSFDGARRIVDVGGSHGAFLAAVLARNPGARGVLFDRPNVVEGAGPALQAAGVSERVERAAGDFFRAVPAGGDVYLLKHILHDWNDDQCVEILTNVRAALGRGGRVVIVEMVIDPAGPPSPAPLLDLNMLVMLTGRERAVDEFAALFERSRLQLAGVTPTHSPFVVIEASPV